MAPNSSHYRMADQLAGGKLEQILLNYRAAGLSPDPIAARLFSEYRIEVTGQTVGNWLTALTPPPNEQEATG